eukprot:604163-Prorocentrum_lima.AAC.1
MFAEIGKSLLADRSITALGRKEAARRRQSDLRVHGDTAITEHAHGPRSVPQVREAREPLPALCQPES